MARQRRAQRCLFLFPLAFFLAAAAPAAASSDGIYDHDRQGCTLGSYTYDKRNEAEPGCQNFTVQAGTGDENDAVRLGFDQTPEGTGPHSGSIKVGEKGESPTDDSKRAATVDFDPGYAVVGPRTLTDGESEDPRIEQVSPTDVRPSADPGKISSEPPRRPLDESFYFWMDDNFFEFGEHHSISQANDPQRDAPVAKGPVSGGGIRADTHPDTESPQENVDPNDRNRPIRAAEARVGFCADGWCMTTQTEKRTVYEGGSDDEHAAYDYSGLHSSDCDFRNPGSNCREEYDREGSVYAPPGVTTYQDPDPQSPKGYGPDELEEVLYPFPASHVGADGVLVDGNWVVDRRSEAGGPFVAEEITAANAGDRLFGGSDPAGGIGDFYLSNGVVEAVIDGAGDQDDLVPLGVHVPKQNSAGPTGGYLVDLARSGKHNDQLSQVMLVVGLDFNQIPRYSTVESSIEMDAAVVRSIGTVPFDTDGPGPGGAVQLEIVTEYRAQGVRPALTLRTTISNPGPLPVPLVDVLDASIWAGKGPIPFTPLPGKGFHHHTLPDFNQPQNLAPAFEVAPYVVAVGMLDERDGRMDDGIDPRASSGVCYGFVSGGGMLDPDGPGPLPAAPAVGSPLLFGLNNMLTTAVGFAGPNVIPPGGSFSYSREIFVGTRSDAAACTEMIFDHFGVPTVEATGRVLDAGDNPVDASLVISPVNPLPIPGLVPGAPLTQVRTAVDGSFSLRLPVGSYQVRATASERPAVEGRLVVRSADVAQLSLPPMAGVAKLDLDVTVAGAPAPATVSFLPVDGEPPRIGKRFDVFTFDTSRSGACAAATSNSCLSDAECADAGPCIRVCSLDPDRRCSSEADCLPGQCIAAIDEHPETLGGGNAQGNVVHTSDGFARVEIRPGKYRALANRGLEYTVAEAEVNAAAGDSVPVPLSIEHAVDTSGLLSADFHIHSGRSFDSSAPLEGRVVSFAAEGVEVMVSSEHDFHLDYSPIIASLGLDNWVTAIPGNEVTTGTVPTVGNEFKFGHLNGFPVPVDPNERRRGAIEDEFVSPNWIYTRLRKQGAKVVQINHPRAPTQAGSTGIGWFNNAGFDPTLPVEDPTNVFLLDGRVAPGFEALNPEWRNIDFDTLEVANAARPADFLAYRAVRRDWMSLLLQGYFKPATGVSDSHRLTVETPGYARTLVLGVGDEPDELDREKFYQSVIDGRMLVTTGPIIRVTAKKGEAVSGIGDTLESGDGDIDLAIRVDAAPWIPVEEIRVLVNGKVERTFDVSGQATNPRYEATLSLHLDADSFIVVEAGPLLPDDPSVAPQPSGKAMGSDVAYSEVVPGAIAFGFTNPIFVDVGGPPFTPPGLPDCAKEPLSVICEAPPSLESDASHEPEVGFLTRIRIPEEMLTTLGSRR